LQGLFDAADYFRRNAVDPGDPVHDVGAALFGQMVEDSGGMLHLLGGENQGDGLRVFLLEQAGHHVRLHQGDGFQGTGFLVVGELLDELFRPFLVAAAGDGIFDELVAAHEDPGVALLGTMKFGHDVPGQLGRDMVDVHHAAADFPHLLIVEQGEDARRGVFAETQQQ
jgi:hypothetical protein